LGKLPCLNCKHAVVNRSEISPNNVFIRCDYNNNGRWKFYKLNREYNFKCEKYEPKEQ